MILLLLLGIALAVLIYRITRFAYTKEVTLLLLPPSLSGELSYGDKVKLNGEQWTVCSRQGATVLALKRRVWRRDV